MMLRWLSRESPCKNGTCPTLWGTENVFDDAEAYRMHYTEAGQFIGAELLADDRLDEYRRYRDAALAHAMPFSEYRTA